MKILIAILSALFLGFIPLYFCINEHPLLMPYYMGWVFFVAIGLGLLVPISIQGLKIKTLWKRVLWGWMFTGVVIMISIVTYDVVRSGHVSKTAAYAQGKLWWQYSVDHLVQNYSEADLDSVHLQFVAQLPPYYQPRVRTLTEGVLRGYWGKLDSIELEKYAAWEARDYDIMAQFSELSVYALDTLHRIDYARALLKHAAMPLDVNTRAAGLFQVYQEFGDLEIDKAAFMSILTFNHKTLHTTTAAGFALFDEIKARLEKDGGATMDLRNLGLCALPENPPEFLKVKKILIESNHINTSKDYSAAWNALLPENWKTTQSAADADCFEQMFLGEAPEIFFLNHPLVTRTNSNPPKIGEQRLAGRMILPIWDSEAMDKVIGWIPRGEELKITKVLNDGALCRFLWVTEDSTAPICKEASEVCYTPCAFLMPSHSKFPDPQADFQKWNGNGGDEWAVTNALEDYVSSSHDYYALVRLAQKQGLPHRTVCKYLQADIAAGVSGYYLLGAGISVKPLQYSVMTDDSLPGELKLPKTRKSLFTEDRNVALENGSASAVLHFIYLNHWGYNYELVGQAPEEVEEVVEETEQYDGEDGPEDGGDAGDDEVDEGPDNSWDGIRLCGYDTVKVLIDSSMTALRLDILDSEFNVVPDSLEYFMAPIFAENDSALTPAEASYRDPGSSMTGHILTTKKVDLEKITQKKFKDGSVAMDLNGDGAWDLYLYVDEDESFDQNYAHVLANINGQWKRIDYPVTRLDEEEPDGPYDGLGE